MSVAVAPFRSSTPSHGFRAVATKRAGPGEWAFNTSHEISPQSADRCTAAGEQLARLSGSPVCCLASLRTKVTRRPEQRCRDAGHRQDHADEQEHGGELERAPGPHTKIIRDPGAS